MRAIWLAAMTILWTGGAEAQDRERCGAGLVCASDPQTVVAAMDKAELKPKLTVDNQGDAMIESEEGPYHFDVFFYGCEETRNCDSLRFEAAFQKEPENTTELANKWNASKRFLQASIKADGRFVVAYDVPTIGGINQRNFADVLDWWNSMLGELATFFQEELKPEQLAPKTTS